MNCTATVPATGQNNVAVQFSASATASGCTTQPVYEWDFGDGTPHSSQQNPTHTYSAAGTYNWTMTASVGSGAQMIDTIAGGMGEGNPARQTPFGILGSIARDPLGRGLYVSDVNDDKILIRFINTGNSAVTLGGVQIAAGTVRTIAGGGTDLGENVPALQADLGEVTGLAVSANGDLVYFANRIDEQVRAINVSAGALTVAGQQVGPGRVRTLASKPFSFLYGLSVHPSTGEVYVIDVIGGENKVYKISSGGTFTAVAGNGANTSVDAPFVAGPALNVPLREPRDLAFDAAGNLYIADSGHGRVIRVDGSGNATLTHQFQIFVNGVNQNPYPSGLAFVNSSLYVTLGNGQTVVRLTGGVTTIAGKSGTTCNYSISNCGDDGAAANAEFSLMGSTATPPLAGIEGDQNGLYVLDQSASEKGRVRYINVTGGSVTVAGLSIGPGVIRTIAGNGRPLPYDGDLATGATFNTPSGVAMDGAGNLWIADTIHHRLRFVNRSANSVTIFAGTPAAQTVPAGGIVTVNNNTGGPTDGVPVTQATFDSPQGLFVTNQGVYVVDSRGGVQVPLGFGGRKTSVIRFINTTSNNVTIFPGAGGNAITVPPGHIQKIAGGADELVPGNGNGGFATLAKFFGSSDIVVTSNGTIYVTEVGEKAVRKIDGNTGVVSTLSLSQKEYTGLGFDSGGRLLIANFTDGVVLRETSAGSGSFTTFASGLGKPRDVAGSSDGGAYVTDGALSQFSGNHRIIRITSGGTTSVVAGGSSPGFAGDGGPASAGLINIGPTALVVGSGVENQLPRTVNIIVTPTGDVIFTDSNNNRIRRIAAAAVTCVKTGTITISGNNPAPTLTSISPNSHLVNSGAFTLTANGNNFAPSSVIRWNGQNRTTTFVSTTQLTASIPASDLSNPGTVQVTVFTPSPGGGTSSPQTFTITQPNPVPTITSLDPNTRTEGSPGFTLMVNGSNFVNGSVVRWDGEDRMTTFVSSTKLTAQILSTDLIGLGQASVTVFNPAPGGGLSNVATFNITAPTSPVPVLNSISPSSISAGAAAFALVANGSGFVSTSKVRWNGVDLQTAFTSSTQLTAQVTADLVATAGTAQITVFTPTPGGGTSATRTFTINPSSNNPVPTVTALSPPAVGVGTGGFTLRVTGTGFVAGSQVRINGNTRLTTVVSATQLTATILGSDIETLGDKPITVFNPTPGGGTSTAMMLKVMPAVASVSAASFMLGPVAPDTMVAAFGVGMANGVELASALPLPTNLLGTTVTVVDSAFVSRPAGLFFVAPTQINFLVPPGTAEGAAKVIVAINGAVVGAGSMNITKTAPGLFAANANGQGVAAAVALRVKANDEQSFEPVSTPGQGGLVPLPIDMGPQGDTIYLVLFGTGIRHRTNVQDIILNLNGVSRPLDPALFENGFAAPGFEGLDQVNIQLPRTLIGSGVVGISLTIDGRTSNTVQIAVK